jgi:predicted N-formylglutamate amidohydrolase
MQQLISPSAALASDPVSFAIERSTAPASLLILCDHATNQFPPEYGNLGLNSADLNRHIAYDIGALAVARELGRQLDSAVISSRFSRLLIDPNRGQDDPTLIMRLSDGTIVPGNATVDEAERCHRIAAFYKPYHDAIASELNAITARGAVPAIVSIHSFTEAWRGLPRKWAASVLWDNDPRLAVPLIAELRKEAGFEIGDNEPYTGRLRNDSIYRHATLRGLPNALIEVRQDLIRDPSGQREWAQRLGRCLSKVLRGKPHARALSRVEYFGSKTDIDLSGANLTFESPPQQTLAQMPNSKAPRESKSC